MFTLRVSNKIISESLKMISWITFFIHPHALIKLTFLTFLKNINLQTAYFQALLKIDFYLFIPEKRPVHSKQTVGSCPPIINQKGSPISAKKATPRSENFSSPGGKRNSNSGTPKTPVKAKLTSSTSPLYRTCIYSKSILISISGGSSQPPSRSSIDSPFTLSLKSGNPWGDKVRLIHATVLYPFEDLKNGDRKQYAIEQTTQCCTSICILKSILIVSFWKRKTKIE